jgi:hypothetical protein
MPGMPELPDKFIDNAWYLSKLSEFQAIRASGKSLDHCMHTVLFGRYVLFLLTNFIRMILLIELMEIVLVVIGRKPTDISALKTHIKTLYDEECDILISKPRNRHLFC